MWTARVGGSELAASEGTNDHLPAARAPFTISTFQQTILPYYTYEERGTKKHLAGKVPWDSSRDSCEAWTGGRLLAAFKTTLPARPITRRGDRALHDWRGLAIRCQTWRRSRPADSVLGVTEVKVIKYFARYLGINGTPYRSR